MVYRIFSEKKKELANEAEALLSDIKGLLQIDSVTELRIINRYDAENITKELFDYAVKTVFSEPQLDNTYSELENDAAAVFAVEFLPGQFDQRADSAAQCIQLISQKERPLIRTAKVYMLYGDITEAELAAVKKYVINPVEAREAGLSKPETLAVNYDIPESVATLDGFTALSREQLDEFVKKIRLGYGYRRYSLLSGLFQVRTARSDHDRNKNDRHLLVGPLPPYHLSHPYRRRDF